MRIGLDFDGVISDAGRLKSEGARILYGIEIQPEQFKKELVVGAGILTAEQYRYLQTQIYDNAELGLKMVPVDRALEYIDRLQKEDHELLIITSRSNCEIPMNWMLSQGLKMEIVSAGIGNTKAESCRGLDVYIDDDFDKLEPLVRVVPHRFLLSWPYNEHIECPPTVAQRVDSWKNFYKEVLAIRIN